MSIGHFTAHGPGNGAAGAAGGVQLVPCNCDCDCCANSGGNNDTRHHCCGGSQCTCCPIAQQYAIVPFANCTKIVKGVCYQGSQSATAEVIKLDPLACKPPAVARLLRGTCSSAGFNKYVGNDPIFKAVGLWSKVSPSPPPRSDAEKMIVCSGKCTSDCKAYSPPLGICYSPPKLWPGDVQWGTADTLDTCNGTHLDRSFYSSSNGSCTARTDGFSLPLDTCVGPFGKPRPWGNFSCGGYGGGGGLEEHGVSISAPRGDKRPEVVGWWVGAIDDASLAQLQLLDWSVYTIVRPQFGPLVSPNGSCTCQLTEPEAKFMHIVHQHGLLVQASPNHNVTRSLPKEVGGAGDMAYRRNYLSTIGAAVAACEFDGLEFDYEPLNACEDCSKYNPSACGACIMTPRHATEFTVLMADIKVAMGGKLVSSDVGVWGLSQGTYPALTVPWVNVSMLNAGEIDFVNTMSYHHPRAGGIAPWQGDAAWFDRHGFDRSRVNLGLPYYSFNYTNNAISPTHPGEKVVGEPTWATLSKLCPNAAPEANICKMVAYCGKAQNEAIGSLVREGGWRGVFPWAANYDSLDAELNNSLAAWLGKGLRGE